MNQIIHVPSLSTVATLLDVGQQPLVLASFRLGEFYALIDRIGVFRPEHVHDSAHIRCVGLERIGTDGSLLCHQSTKNRTLKPPKTRTSLPGRRLPARTL